MEAQFVLLLCIFVRLECFALFICLCAALGSAAPYMVVVLHNQLKGKMVVVCLQLLPQLLYSTRLYIFAFNFDFLSFLLQNPEVCELPRAANDM